MRFVNHLTYWNERTKGSNPHWFKKRSEVHAWINEHMQLNNGPPTYFITLSCAEYFWPDVIELLKQRMSMAGLDTSMVYVGSPKLIQLVNDYTIVIQEYFQKRVETWLQTVGKKIFSIKHYWVRYEFAPGRGQIHAHLLAIPDNHDIFVSCHRLLKDQDGQEARAKCMAKWAQSTFGLTASVSEGFDDQSTEDCSAHVQMRFLDVGDDLESQLEDTQRLLCVCQQHKCSEFCMRKRNKKTHLRSCKVGAGQEQTVGTADTPGFPLHSEPQVITDHRRAKKLCMPRNHKRLNQTSLDLLRSWRGNCDVQVLIYDNDPRYPNLAEVAKVTDYVVSYACKGSASLKEEREQNKNLIIG